METSVPHAGSQLAAVTICHPVLYCVDLLRVSLPEELFKMAVSSQGNFEGNFESLDLAEFAKKHPWRLMLANHTGYIKVDWQQVEKDMKKAKEKPKTCKSNQIPTEVKNKAEEVVPFVKNVQ
ncbi:FUN14 domain-containing protein 2 [Tupaia chinensis]|uniref:FUN14 domain-containing protein 2 n=1 Tax=Tupaia chinensis TaxID=246437 RepID=L9KKK1_TUPCH|nr:FUN14 domain-containing protein 2 [Tupaia chinensis]